MNWRRSDIISATTLLTLAGYIWMASAKNSMIEENKKSIEELEPRMSTVEKQEVEFEARNTAQMTYIIRELDSINKKIGRD